MDAQTETETEIVRCLEAEVQRTLELNFCEYVREVWEVLHPFEPLVDSYYIDAIGEHMQAVYAGQISRLIVNQPPRTAKSTFITIMFPTWVWTTRPWWKFIFYSYSFEKLSVPHSLERRRILQSMFYQHRWGKQFYLSIDENMKWKFSNSKTGFMEVVSQATGTGGNILIIDDPHSVEEALSEAEREAGVTKVRQGLLSRLNNPQSDPVVIVMQRLHDSDVSGQFLKDGGWTHLCLPAKVEKKAVTVTLPISGRKWERKVGDLLDPVRLSDKVLEQKQIELGTKAYYGQYQQEPAPPGGLIFKSEWWRWWKHLPELEQIVISVDCAFKETKESTDVAVQGWGIAGIYSFLLARDTRKMGFAATKAAIRKMHSDLGARVVLIEDKANGPAIIDELKTEFYVVAIDPGFGDKVARAEGCSPMVEAGTVYLPESTDSNGQQGTGVKIQTLAAQFPNGPKDDVDATTQFLNWRRKHAGSMEWFKAAALKAKAQKPEGEKAPQEHPSPKEVQQLAMEQVGMKVKRSETTKQVKKGELNKELAVTCIDCGSGSLFRSSRGAKCLKCGKVMPLPENVTNIGAPGG